MAALHHLDHALRRLYAACAVLAALAVVGIAAAVSVSIVSRLMGVFVPGMTETAGYGMAAAGSLGLAHTFMERGHIRVDLLIARLGARARGMADVLALAATAALVGFAAWYLCRLVVVSWRFHDRSAGSDGLLLWVVQLPVAVGFVVFTLSVVHTLVLAVAGGGMSSGAAGRD